MRTGIERDGSIRMVRHVEDHDIAWRLEDLELAVVQVTRYALHETPRIRIEKLRRRIGMVFEHQLHLFRGPRLIGDLSIRWIDDETPAPPRRVGREILIDRLKFQVLDVVERADGIPEALYVRLAVRRPRRGVSASCWRRRALSALVFSTDCARALREHNHEGKRDRRADSVLHCGGLSHVCS